MAYSYYQSTDPHWGTNQYQFGSPPSINFQPQPSWGGSDYYRAHAVNPDINLYNNVYNTVAQGGYANSLGVGMAEASHWHRRTYGGLGDLRIMPPEEIGHAAAYEAYRQWSHNRSVLVEPLGGDYPRQRESLVGLAVAEASRLLQYCPHLIANPAAQQRTYAAAAATAALIFDESRNGPYDAGYAMSGSPYTSFPTGSSFDSYPLSSDSYGAHRHRSHSRVRAGSFSGVPMTAGLAVPGTAGGFYAGQPYSTGQPYGQSYSTGQSYGTGQPYGQSYSTGQQYGTGVGYPGSYPVAQTLSAQPQYSYGMPPATMVAQPTVYTTGGHHRHHRSRSMSVAYPSMAYPTVTPVTAGGLMSMPQQQPPIVIQSAPRHHHHRSSSHHNRSRSRNRVILV